VHTAVNWNLIRTTWRHDHCETNTIIWHPGVIQVSNESVPGKHQHLINRTQVTRQIERSLKDIVIVSSQPKLKNNISFWNWEYVVLWRVPSIKGLFFSANQQGTVIQTNRGTHTIHEASRVGENPHTTKESNCNPELNSITNNSLKQVYSTSAYAIIISTYTIIITELCTSWMFCSP
jgi:hypothetical protein